MPWHDGEPPKDGQEYPCKSPNYDGTVMLRWYKHNGTAAFRDWDLDPYDRITRWHDLT